MELLLVLSRLLKLFCQVLSIAIFIRAMISWFSPSPSSQVFNIIYRLTEPILSPLRRVIPLVGMMDFTPLVAIILLQVIIALLP